MEKKSKKKIIILSVVALFLIGGIIAGYTAINKIFSIFSDSFYQVSIQDSGGVPAGEEGQPPANDGTAGEPGSEATPQAQESAAPATAPPAEASSKPSVNLPSGNISAETSKELMEEVSFSDKLSVINILNKNLSASEYKEMVGMLSGGITSAEMKRAKKILSESLTKEDKKKILSYYRKYEDLLE